MLAGGDWKAPVGAGGWVLTAFIRCVGVPVGGVRVRPVTW